MLYLEYNKSMSKEKVEKADKKEKDIHNGKQAGLEEKSSSKSGTATDGMSLKKKILRSCIVLVVVGLVLLLGYYILVWTGAWEFINSVDKIRQLILSLGFWGRLTFVFIQFLQVTFLPIPSTISTLAGVLIYGPLETALLSLAGIMLGSVLAFWLGRVCGRKLVVFMVGKETCDKWTKFLTNAKYSFFFMMLFPMFPDDVLCLVAGLTDMSWAFFVITNLISRPIGIFLTCYLGSGQIIPYHGWGLIAWAFIILAVLAVIILSYKYQSQIENFMQKTFSSHKARVVKAFDVEAGVEQCKRSAKVKKCKSERVKDDLEKNVKHRKIKEKTKKASLTQKNEEKNAK